jgi:hypothetical protein
MVACLDSDESLIRINAYKVLLAAKDPSVTSKQISDSFWLDMVDSKGPPLVYATRTLEPRLAVFGSRTSLRQPLTFMAFDQTLSIATDSANPSLLSIFYRGDELPAPVSTRSHANVAELVARLGGAADERLRFGYADIVGILQSMADSGKVASAFVLQDQPGLEDALLGIPDATGGSGNGRPVGEPAAAAPRAEATPQPAAVSAEAAAAAAARGAQPTPGRPN